VEAWIGSAVVAVVISSIVTIAGWYATHRSERLIEASRRQERIQDIQTALLADIRSTSHRYMQVDIDRHLDEVLERMQAAPDSDPHTPFVPREPGSLLWPSIAQEVHILPNEVIDAVILFFSQLETIRCFVEDLRSDCFITLQKSRKAAMYRDYIRLSKHLLVLGSQAEDALHKALQLPPQ
jgi:hypothetical protein